MAALLEYAMTNTTYHLSNEIVGLSVGPSVHSRLHLSFELFGLLVYESVTGRTDGRMNEQTVLLTYEVASIKWPRR